MVGAGASREQEEDGSSTELAQRGPQRGPQQVQLPREDRSPHFLLFPLFWGF